MKKNNENKTMRKKTIPITVGLEYDCGTWPRKHRYPCDSGTDKASEPLLAAP
jgi:hypothetical protein